MGLFGYCQILFRIEKLESSKIVNYRLFKAILSCHIARMFLICTLDSKTLLPFLPSTHMAISCAVIKSEQWFNSLTSYAEMSPFSYCQIVLRSENF